MINRCVESLALTADGALWSWGGGSFGQLGHGAQPRRHLPKTGEAKALALRRAVQWSLPDSPDPLSEHPKPLPSLRPANLQPAAEAVAVGRLILKAAEWSPQSHELFPEPARKWAVEVMRLGYLIAWDEERFEGREGAAPELADIWRGFVLPRVVVR